MAIDLQRKSTRIEENTQNPQRPEVSVFKVFFYGIKTLQKNIKPRALMYQWF